MQRRTPAPRRRVTWARDRRAASFWPLPTTTASPRAAGCAPSPRAFAKRPPASSAAARSTRSPTTLLGDEPTDHRSRLCAFQQRPRRRALLRLEQLRGPAASFRDAGGFDETFRTSEDREICERWRSRGLDLTYEPHAVVRHSHRSRSARSGVSTSATAAAHAASTARARARATTVQTRPDFYTKLLRSALTRTPKTKAARLTALLLWSQAANAAGFFYEKFRKA